MIDRVEYFVGSYRRSMSRDEGWGFESEMHDAYARSFCKTGQRPTHWILGRETYAMLCGACIIRDPNPNFIRPKEYRGMGIIETADEQFIGVGVLQ